MITQLKFALGDIKSRPLAFILSFIQIMCALLMIAMSCFILDNTFDYRSKFNIFEDTSEMYFIRDNTTEEHFNKMWEDEKHSEKKAYEFYQFLNDNNDNICYSFNSNVTMLNTATSLNTAEYIDEDNGAIYRTLKINKNFAKYFKLECKTGQIFSNSDYNDKNKTTPVVLGYNYKKYYKIGDEIIKNHIVIGFLAKKSFYLDPKSCGDILYLDNTIITPMIINEKTDICDFDTAIMSTTILTKNPKNLELISKKSEELGLYDISFTNYSEQLNSIVSRALKKVMIILMIVALVLFFCVVCLVCSMLNFVETHKREFAVHLLCGATKFDFIVRIIWQIAVIIILGDFITFAVFKLSLAFIGTLLISLILLMIILALPILKIRNQSVNELLKRSE